MAAPPRPPVAAASDTAIAAAIKDKAHGDFKRFYRQRDYQPLWLDGTTFGPQAEKLISYLATA